MLTDKTAHVSIDFSCGAKELNVKLETVLPGVRYKASCKHQLFAISKNVQINKYLSFERSNIFIGHLKVVFLVLQTGKVEEF